MPIDQSSELRLYGVVGEDFTCDSIADHIAVYGNPELVRINSPGGYVFEGIALHTFLRERRPRVIVDGLAASIASIIACCGARVEIAEGAMMMVHNPWNLTIGDAPEMRKSAETLDQIREAMLDIYERRTGLSRGLLTSMLDAETWLTASEAVELGFCDAIATPEHESETAAAAIARLDLSILPGAAAALARGNKMDKTKLSRRQREELREREQASRAQARAETITHAVATAGLPDVLAENLIKKNASADEVQAAIQRAQDYFAQADDQLEIDGVCTMYGRDVSGGEGYGGHGPASFIENASEAIVARAQSRRTNSPLAGASLADIAQACIEGSGGTIWRGRRNRSPIRAALSTSDFPRILEDALRKSVRSGMDSEAGTHRLWVRISETPDFRRQSRPTLSSAPDLELVPEGGEFNHGAMDDDAAGFEIQKFGKILGLTFEAMTNDDLGVFARIAPQMGQAAIRKEADVVYALLTANSGDGATMPQDSEPLFHSDHKNIVTAAAFGPELLAAGRAKMRRQRDISGQGWLNPVPRFLIVPPELEDAALRLVRASSVEQAAGTFDTPDTTNASFAGPAGWLADLTVIAEPRLEAEAVSYLASSFNQVDHIELAALIGSPEIAQQDGFETDSIRWRIRHVFGAGALDWRGLVRMTVTS